MGDFGTLQPIVDIVILSWNRLEHTLQAMESAMDQVDAEPRIWIVDQGSDRGTLTALHHLASADQTIHLHECGHNPGVAEGRNIGMSLGSAEWIVCLDNDATLITKNALAHVAAIFGNDATLAAIGFKIVDSETGRDEIASWGYARSLLAKSNEGFVTTRYVGAGHALRRDALEKTDGYDKELFFYWEELDLSYQLINLGYRIVYDPTVVVQHRASFKMRAHWYDVRYYYHVRNAVYLEYKYFRSPIRLALQAVGYLAKGIFNGLSGQAVQGVIDAIRMLGRSRELRKNRLSKESRTYIWKHDVRYRGNVYQRIRDEVFVSLPGLKREREKHSRHGA